MTGHITRQEFSSDLNAEMDGNLSKIGILNGLVVNVKASPYNAKGDGVTDDTTSIQSAINTIQANGGRLYFPVGIYKITNNLSIPFMTGFIIEGHSRGSVTIKQFTDNTPIFRFTTALTHSWIIKDIDFEYANVQPVTNTLAIPIYFALDIGNGGNGYFNCQIERCTFNSGYYGIKNNESATSVTVWGITIKDCEFGGSLSGGGIYLSPNPSLGQPEINLENLYFFCNSMTKQAIYITSSDTVMLKSVEFNGGTYSQGIVSQVEIDSCNVVLINTRAESLTANGVINIWNFANSIVTVMSCTIGSLNVAAGGNVNCINAGTGGRLAVHGLTVGGTLGSGASATAVASDNLVCVENLIALNSFTRYLSYTKLPFLDVDLLQPIKTKVRGDENVVLTIADYSLQYFNTPLTANRAISLPTTGLYDGMTYTIVKWTTAAFTLTIQDNNSGKNTVLPSGTKASVTYRAISSGEWIPINYSTFA